MGGMVGPAEDRRRRIVELARGRGRIEVAVAARHLGVSPETLRRDLRHLEARGLIRRTYGAILPTEVGRYEIPMELRSGTEAEEKERIAIKVADLITDASAIYLDEGALPMLLLRHLPVGPGPTVVTPSVPLALELARAGHREVILLGGRLRSITYGTVDHWAIDMLATLKVDLAIMGANGVSLEHGVTTPDPAVSAVKAAAVRSARRTLLAIEHTKFGVVSFARYAGVGELDLVVTGRRLGSAVAHRYRLSGPRMILV